MLQEWLTALLQDQREFGSQAWSVSRQSSPPGLKLCNYVEVSGHNEADVTRLREVILEVAKDRTMFPDLGSTLPKWMERMWAVMDALRVGANPGVAVRLEDVVPTGIHPGLEFVTQRRIHAGLEFVTQRKAFEVWRDAETGRAGESNEDEARLEAQFKVPSFFQEVHVALVKG